MQTLVRTKIPYPLIWDDGRLHIRIKESVFDVRFRRQYREGSNNVEIRHDRLERVANTTVKILFPTLVEDKNERLMWVHAVLNRLIEVYRFTTGEFYLDTLPKNELPDFEVLIVNDDGTLSPDMTHVWSFGLGLTLARTARVPDEARQLLVESTELPIARILYLNARREELLENYRLAVVEAESAFEVSVHEIVSRYYRNGGVSPAKIDNILDAGLKNLLQDHVPKSCGKQFVGTEEHGVWEARLYDLRNKIVHQGVSVTADDARNALAAAERALEWLANRALI